MNNTWSMPMEVYGEPAAGQTTAADMYGLYNENMRVLRPDEDVTAARQQHRNVFAERCRLANRRPPDSETMLAWWPGTVAVFA